MIHSFQCSNFFSIKDKALVDFTATASKATTDGYIRSNILKDVYLSKVNAIFGPNASGKTNILRALSFISWLIADSFDRKPDDDFPYVIYRGKGASKDTSFEVVFELSEHLYKYSVELSIGAEGKDCYISYEQLFEFNTETNEFNSLYRRKKEDRVDDYTFTEGGLSVKAPREAISRDDTSMLSIAVRYNHEKAREIVSYWESIKESASVSFAGGYFDGSLSFRVMEASKLAFENKEIRAKVTDLLNRMDVGLSEIQVDEKKIVYKSEGPSPDKERTVYRAFFHRKSKDSDNAVVVPAYLESIGVRSLFSHITQVLVHLSSEKASIIVLDEIDSGIHPELIPVFFDIFRSKTMNPFGHQLLVTLHSNDVMDDLEKGQIFLTEMVDLQTKIQPLSSFRNVRKDVSFAASYRAGRFGAIPRL